MTAIVVVSVLMVVHPGPRPVGFEEFVSRIVAFSGEMERYRARVRLAEQGVRSADRLRYPTVKIRLMGAPSHRYVCVVPEAWNTPEARDGMSEEEFRRKFCVGTDRDDTFTWELDGYVARFEIEAVQPLYTFGRIDLIRKAARHARASAVYSMMAARMEARALAARLFYARKLAIETREVLREGEELLDTFRERFERLESQGKLKPSDRFRFRLGVLDVRRAVEQAEQALRETRAAMDAYGCAGLEAGGPDLASVPRRVPSLQDLTRMAIASNPRLKALRTALVAARLRARSEARAWYPQVGLFVRYRYTTSNSDDPENAFLNDQLHGNSVSGALVVSGSWDFARTSLRVATARAEVQDLEARLTSERQEMMRRLGSLHAKATALVAQIRLVSKALKVARAWVGVIKEKDDTGAPYDPRDAVAAVKAYFQYRLERLVLYARLWSVLREMEAVAGSKIVQ